MKMKHYLNDCPSCAKFTWHISSLQDACANVEWTILICRLICGNVQNAWRSETLMYVQKPMINKNSTLSSCI
eukprot:UN05950